jgi:hypothetical protein
MNNIKQSSVEWLISQLQKSKDWHRVLNEVSQMSSARVDIIAEAKAMHKEEIEEAHFAPKYGCFSEHYYNENIRR